jgi:hypothetical protein
VAAALARTARVVQVVPFQSLRKPVLRVVEIMAFYEQRNGTFFRTFGPILISPANAYDKVPVAAAFNTNAVGTKEII